MDSQFKKSIDARLQVSDTLAYNVVSGAASITSQKVQASSVNVNQATFNVQVPSQKTCIDPHLLWTQRIQIKVVGTCAAGSWLCDYGNTDALCPFPNHALLNTLSNTVNNATTTVNVNEIMAGLLHCFDPDDLNLYQSITTTALDRYHEYSEGITAKNNVLAGYEGADLNNHFVPRGAFKLISISTAPDSVVAPVVAPAGGATNITNYLTFESTEPFLFCAPWAYTYKEDRPCLTGVTNMNFNMNFNAGAKLLRWANVAGVTAKSCSVYNVSESVLHFQMLTPHSSMVMPARSVLPYYQLPRYSQTITGAINPSAITSLVSTTMSLNSIPDTLIVFARDASRVTGASADAFFKIEGINLNWNNNNGLLTGFTSHQLYTMSVRNGLSKNFYEWSGSAHVGHALANIGVGGADYSMSGGVLILKFGKDIQLSDTEAPGSLGNYQLQFSLNIKNQTGSAIAATGVELITIAVNSGLMITEAGVTTTQLGILTAADVIKVAEQPEDFRYGPRVLGGGVFDKLNSVVPHARKFMSSIGDVLQSDKIKQVGSVLKSLGGKNRFQ
jgi:hypothetical protein